MKKYKVVTDNLDWLAIDKGDELFYNEERKTLDDNRRVIRMSNRVFLKHPEWFEEIKEKEFTREDMMDFSRYVHYHWIDDTLFKDGLDNWLKQRK